MTTGSTEAPRLPLRAAGRGAWTRVNNTAPPARKWNSGLRRQHIRRALREPPCALPFPGGAACSARLQLAAFEHPEPALRAVVAADAQVDVDEVVGLIGVGKVHRDGLQHQLFEA